MAAQCPNRSGRQELKKGGQSRITASPNSLLLRDEQSVSEGPLALLHYLCETTTRQIAVSGNATACAFPQPRSVSLSAFCVVLNSLILESVIVTVRLLAG